MQEQEGRFGIPTICTLTSFEQAKMAGDALALSDPQGVDEAMETATAQADGEDQLYSVVVPQDQSSDIGREVEVAHSKQKRSLRIIGPILQSLTACRRCSSLQFHILHLRVPLRSHESNLCFSDILRQRILPIIRRIDLNSQPG